MKQALALAMFLFDTYSEMADEDQAQALAALKTVDPVIHDALVQLLVTDALTHALDVPPWQDAVTASLAIDHRIHEEMATANREAS
ncbi:MAG: hypothetical protein C0521_02750 [Xanthomonas sp.]|uniref:hypothetical protein n=1 Tax=Pseudoxanthomonas mexicana TaxID=128785 RepID=UPI0007854805|nr:hypothetical protein [Pseudoxanthomonas mexicana]MBA3928489.1 hypothetical protein [Xanthomonas sp.]